MDHCRGSFLRSTGHACAVLFALAVWLGLSASLVPLVDAATFTVDRTDDDATAMACDDAIPNDCSLRGAILAANERPMSEASTINVPAGTYVLSQSSSCTYTLPTMVPITSSQIPLCLSKKVTIQGAGAASTIIDGDQRGRVLFVSTAAIVEIRGVTITHGLSDHSFGLIPYGGGIVNEGTLTLTDSVVRNNSVPAGATNGGGIYNTSVLTLRRSAVSDNVSPGGQQGGGIFNEARATLTVSDSTISNNIINGGGGGIANNGGPVTITGSTISNNSVNGGLGGGITNGGFPDALGLLTITNSTISGNTSGSAGGGIFAGNLGDTHLSNVTITNNTGATNGAGSGGGVAGGPFTLRNTVIAGNMDVFFGTSPDCAARLTSEGYNLIQDLDGCIITGDLTGNIVGQDARLGLLGDYGGPTETHALRDGSPALNAGSPAAPGSGGTACAATDQRGFLRSLGAACDIGAFERGGAFSLVRVTPNSGGNDGSVIAILSGGGFAPEATGALLRRAGHADIAGSPVATDLGGAALTTTFDLTGADLGSWDVVVTNPDLASVTLPGGFTVETPRAADLFAVVVARSSARPGLPARFAVLYGNRGNTDALGVPLTLGLPASFARRFPFGLAGPPAQPGQAYNDYSDVPFEVTTPVAGDQVAIPLLIPIVPAGFTGLLAFTLTPPAVIKVGETFTIEALVGTPWFTNGSVRADIVADAAVRARQFAAHGLGITAPPGLDPVLIAYETAALELAVASARDELVHNLGQSRRPMSLAYLAMDLAGYVAVQTTASAAPAPLTRLAALPQRLARLLGLGADVAEAEVICPPCICGAPVPGGCYSCTAAQCIPPPAKPSKKPPDGLTPGECNDLPKHIVSADGTTCKPDGSTPCPKGFGSPFFTDPSCRTYPIRGSGDPNDKAGSGGAGPERFVAARTLLPYLIAFENVPTATAAAQRVVVTDQLDTQTLDLDTFVLGPIFVGEVGIIPAPGEAQFSGGADLRPAHNVLLRVDAGLDKTTGIVTWLFTSLDPSTMETLMDPDEGFLPPNTNPPAGDAQVHFTILPKPGLATGTAIRNHARVVFDTNAPIDTPEWLNIVDASAPTSQVLPLAATQSAPTFPVQWAGTDGGSGLADYTIFVSKNGGPFTSFLANTTETAALFPGQVGNTYAFYSVARDLTGNEEAPPIMADTTTQVVVPACAMNVSAQVTVTRGGFRRNSLTGRYVQQVTLKNSSSGVLAGPLSLALDTLSSNATLFNKTGQTSCATPVGPYETVSVGTDNVLSAGESATVVLEFTNPSNTSITYSTRVLAGTP